MMFRQAPLENISHTGAGEAGAAFVDSGDAEENLIAN